MSAVTVEKLAKIIGSEGETLLSQMKEAGLSHKDVKDEVSVTSGHPYKSSTVTAKSGKNNFSFFSHYNKFYYLAKQSKHSYMVHSKNSKYY